MKRFTIRTENGEQVLYENVMLGGSIDADGNVTDTAKVATPMDYSGLLSTFQNESVSNVREDPTTDGGTQPSAGARIVSLVFVEGVATVAKKLYVVFNAADATAAGVALADPAQRQMITLNERRSFSREEGDEITRIDFLTDVAETGTNSVSGEYLI